VPVDETLAMIAKGDIMGQSPISRVSHVYRADEYKVAITTYFPVILNTRNFSALGVLDFG